MAISGDYSNNDKKIYTGGTLSDVEVKASKPKKNFLTDAIKKLTTPSAPDMLTATTAEIMGVELSTKKANQVETADTSTPFGIDVHNVDNEIKRESFHLVSDPLTQAYMYGNLSADNTVRGFDLGGKYSNDLFDLMENGLYVPPETVA